MQQKKNKQVYKISQRFIEFKISKHEILSNLENIGMH